MQADTPQRWVGTGRTVYNNKGKPIKQYEPFFSSTHLYEEEPEMTDTGVSPILFYDPVERVVATLHPNHTYEKVLFDPWQQTIWDVNDTLKKPGPAAPPFDPKSDPDVGHYLARLLGDYYLPTWYDMRTDAAKALLAWPDTDAQSRPLPDNAKLRAAEKSAAEKAVAHADTPSTAHFDALGRPFLTFARNRVVCAKHTLDGTEGLFATRVELDIEGNQRAVRDERKLPVNGLSLGPLEQRIVMRSAYDMLGNRIHQLSMEAGARWMLNDVAGKPIRAWDSRGHSSRTEYDPLRRPLRTNITGADTAHSNQELLTERLVYGEQHPEAGLRNLRGKLYLHLDQAGVVANEAHDFKGNPLRTSRRLANGTQYKQTVDWLAVDADHIALPTDAKRLLDAVALEATLAPWLETDTYTSTTTYDALNRLVTQTTPHTPAMQPSVIRPGYNEANQLERVAANLRSATANGQPVWTQFVINIDYDAKGQRNLIDYGNGVRTTYDYDPLTFRLVHLLTRRNAAAFPEDCPQNPPAGWPGCQMQNLHYSYDPAGNITHIQDGAQQTIYFKNQRVEPSNDYTYDAMYRLIEATGREHLGQGGASIPHSYNDAGRVGVLSADAASHFAANDGNAMDRYCEKYLYDEVGNFMEVSHHRSCPAAPSWNRTYTHAESGLIEPAKLSNRLSSTMVGNNNPIHEQYGHDAHGNMFLMPQMQVMQWDYKDQLQMTQRQKIENEDTDGHERDGERTWYVYDAVGQRVRKVTELANNGGLKDERIYLGGFEIYHKHSGNHADLARETLHIMDDKQRIGLVETRNALNDGSPKQLIRYQFGNHLGSASLELDEQAQIISYEEYTPYGSTSYQAVRSQTETKRYRYTGKERDEESGLYYHGARYYVPWLGRWTTIDPIESINLYCYALCRPTKLIDPAGRAPVVGPYSKTGPNGEVPVKGDHVSQVSTRTMAPGAARETAPQFKEALSISTKDPTYDDNAAQKTERAINQAQSGKDYKGRPADVPASPQSPGKDGVVALEASGDSKVGKSTPPTPSQWFEDVKSFFKVREAGVDPKVAQKIVSASSDQLQSQGATPARVPDAPRNIPPSLRGGQNLSPEMPLSQIQSQLPPARIGEFVDAVTPTAAKALNVASAVHAAYDISTKTVQTTQEKGPLMGAAQFGKTSAKHATALLWFAVGATVALAIASGGAATPLAAAAIGALITATGTTITHNVIDDLTPGLL